MQHIPKKQFINKNKLYATPSPISHYINHLLHFHPNHVLDLMCGSVSLSQAFHNVNTFVCGVDDDPTAVKMASSNHPSATWWCQDIFTTKFFDIIKNHGHYFDIILSNPRFPAAMPTILVASQFLNKSNESRIIILLPSIYFENEKKI